MRSSTSTARALTLSASWLLLSTTNAFGKRTYDYIPPPYIERVARSFVGLFPVAVILVLVTSILAWRLTAHPKPAIGLLIRISSALLFMGCLVAATDGWNDELSQPWAFGSFFLALIPAVSILVNTAPPRSASFALVAFGVTVPTWLLAAIASALWQDWARHHGIPAGW